MAREIINFIDELSMQKESLIHQINTGIMTSETYQGLSESDKNMVKQVLFEMHSSPVVPPVAFSALEFAVFGLAKLFFKVNGDVSLSLTAEEQAFYDRFNVFIQQHEITMDANDWYVPYAEQGMLTAKSNRQAYKEKKLNITGEF